MLPKIEQHKLDWNVDSKIGSLDNADHKPGGGVKKVTSTHFIHHLLNLHVLCAFCCLSYLLIF